MVTTINFIIHKFKIFLDDEKAEVLSTRDLKNNTHEWFPSCSVVRNLPANAGEMGSIPDLGRPHMITSPRTITIEPPP